MRVQGQLGIIARHSFRRAHANKGLLRSRRRGDGHVRNGLATSRSPHPATQRQQSNKELETLNFNFNNFSHSDFLFNHMSMANIIRHPVGCKQYGLLHIFMGKLSQFPLVDVKRTPTSGKSIMPTKGVRLAYPLSESKAHLRTDENVPRD